MVINNPVRVKLKDKVSMRKNSTKFSILNINYFKLRWRDTSLNLLKQITVPTNI
jgi:hypothetical protein